MKLASELFLRLALAAAYLSAVADRFGWWGPPGSANVAWGNFEKFLEYNRLLLSFLPESFNRPLGWLATLLEIVIAIGLVIGWQLRWFALGSEVLLLLFTITMTVALGAEPAFSYSVWTAAAASFFLAAMNWTPSIKQPE
jgi:uncharacterized membrane protein YphA (DoxX/SURF4 family)